MPLEELLAMYGYGAPPSKEEGEEEEEEEEGVEEETESSPETGQTSITLTSQTRHVTSGPSTSSSRPAPQSRSRRKFTTTSTADTKPIDEDSPSPTSQRVPPQFIHEVIDDHNLTGAEVVMVGECSSSGETSVLGKHPRSDFQSRSGDTLYRDVMFSGQTGVWVGVSVCVGV